MHPRVNNYRTNKMFTREMRLKNELITIYVLHICQHTGDKQTVPL